MMKEKKNIIVAIDGPAGAGKTTTAKLLAEKLNIIHIDSGSIYRSLTYYFIKNKISINQLMEIEKILHSMIIDINKKNEIIINNINTSKFIRRDYVNDKVSIFSALPMVRLKVDAIQKKIAKGKDVVVDGRDIGSSVFPNANIKIYLDANLDVRANRRCKENFEKGINSDYEKVKKQLLNRDEIDENRDYSPLKKAKDAIKLDTSKLSIKEQVEKIYKIIKDNNDR